MTLFSRIFAVCILLAGHVPVAAFARAVPVSTFRAVPAAETFRFPRAWSFAHSWPHAVRRCGLEDLAELPAR